MSWGAGVVATVALFLFFELMVAPWAVTALTFCFLIVLALVSIVLFAGSGLAALLVVAAYVPSFLFLSLILLQFGPYWSPAGSAHRRGVQGTQFVLFLFAALSVVALLVGAPNGFSAALGFGFVGEDFYLTLTEPFSLNSFLYHVFFYSLFVLELLALNAILLVGLVAALLLAPLFSSPQPLARSVSSRSALARAHAAVLPPRGPRTVARQRRATKRTPSSWVRG